MNPEPEPEPAPPTRHYAWPKYVLAALVLFLFICVTWTFREINKVRHYQREKNAARSPAPATNDTPSVNRPRP